MHSIMYAQDGEIFLIGPYDSEDEAMNAGKEHQAIGEFDTRDQFIYLLSGHRLTKLSNSDLGVE